MPIKIIDPHLHLFALSQGAYHWLAPKNPPFWSDKNKIYRSFTEQDLTLSDELSLAAFVHIEAGFDNAHPARELAYLTKTCKQNHHAIASINLLLPPDSFASELINLQKQANFVGVRHILDDQATSILTQQHTFTNVALLNEISQQKPLIFEAQLPLDNRQACSTLAQLISDNKNITFIINHAGFPPKLNDEMAWNNWQESLKSMASHRNVAIKCSGWEMLDREIQSTWVNQCIASCINAFSINRVMLASNFPLCLFSFDNYQAYWQYIVSLDVFKALNTQQKSALLYDNALNLYQLES